MPLKQSAIVKAVTLTTAAASWPLFMSSLWPAEGSDKRRCAGHVAGDRLHQRVVGESPTCDLGYVQGVQGEDVVVGLPGRRRTRTEIAGAARTVGALGKAPGCVRGELPPRRRDVVQNPVAEAARDRRVGVE